MDGKKEMVDWGKKYLVLNDARVGLNRSHWSWEVDPYCITSVQVLPIYV